MGMVDVRTPPIERPHRILLHEAANRIRGRQDGTIHRFVTEHATILRDILDPLSHERKRS
jgi:hypothetical protein